MSIYQFSGLLSILVYYVQHDSVVWDPAHYTHYLQVIPSKIQLVTELRVTREWKAECIDQISIIYTRRYTEGASRHVNWKRQLGYITMRHITGYDQSLYLA